MTAAEMKIKKRRYLGRNIGVAEFVNLPTEGAIVQPIIEKPKVESDQTDQDQEANENGSTDGN